MYIEQGFGARGSGLRVIKKRRKGGMRTSEVHLEGFAVGVKEATHSYTHTHTHTLTLTHSHSHTHTFTLTHRRDEDPRGTS